MADESSLEDRLKPARKSLESTDGLESSGTTNTSKSRISGQTIFLSVPRVLFGWLTGLFRGRKPIVAFIGIVVLIMVFYLPVGMWIRHTIDDDLGFRPGPDQVTDGGSSAVDMTTALVLREVQEHGWVANALPFMPGYYLDNMPNYQKGVMAALSRFVVEMTDQIGRSRGSSQADPDLTQAQGAIKYDGEKWSMVASASADTNYVYAAAALARYNTRLAEKQAIFDARADNLLTTLERISADLGSASAVIDQAVQDNTFFLWDRTSDDHFFDIKGRMYGYAMIMRGLEIDFEAVVRNRNLGAVWTQTISSLEAAAALDPYTIINGSPDGLILPNHLTTMGFYLLRARTQLKEVNAILLR